MNYGLSQWNNLEISKNDIQTFKENVQDYIQVTSSSPRFHRRNMHNFFNNDFNNTIDDNANTNNDNDNLGNINTRSNNNNSSVANENNFSDDDDDPGLFCLHHLRTLVHDYGFNVNFCKFSSSAGVPYIGINEGYRYLLTAIGNRSEKLVSELLKFGMETHLPYCGVVGRPLSESTKPPSTVTVYSMGVAVAANESFNNSVYDDHSVINFFPTLCNSS